MSRKIQLCSEICQIVGHTRKNPTLKTLTWEELMYIHSYLNLTSDLSERVLKEMKRRKKNGKR